MAKKIVITSDNLVALGRRFLSLFVALYLLFLLGRVVYQNYQVRHRIDQIEAEIKNLKSDNQRLANLVTYYQTETFRELEARRKLGLKKPGETVIALPENSDEELKDPREQIQAPGNQPKQVPNWQKWWDYLFENE